MREKFLFLRCWILLLCVLFASGASALAQQAASSDGSPVCSNRTLFGDYGVLIEGVRLDVDVTLRTLNMVHFDGKGTFTFEDYAVINGTPRDPDWTSGSGTYTVNPNCTASAVFYGVIPTHLVVVNSGKDFRGVVDGGAITLVGSRVH